jgi:hypothetical protein
MILYPDMSIPEGPKNHLLLRVLCNLLFQAVLLGVEKKAKVLPVVIVSQTLESQLKEEKKVL